MHENVWEWCADNWHSNYEGAPIDGTAWIDTNQEENVKSDNELYSDKNDNNSSYYLLHGGSWNFNSANCCRGWFFTGVMMLTKKLNKPALAVANRLSIQNYKNLHSLVLNKLNSKQQLLVQDHIVCQFDIPAKLKEK